MSDKKHIDRLFQESFKDFEAQPSDAVWENIESELNKKKKKRRVIPIWWRYAGIAALLLLLLTVGINYFNNGENTQTNQVADTENNATGFPKEQNEKSNDFDDLNKTNEAITDNNTANDNILSEVDNAIVNNNSKESLLQKASKENKQNPLNYNNEPSKESSSKILVSQNKNESRQTNNLPSNDKLNPAHSILKTEDNTTIASNSKEEKSKGIVNKQDGPLIDKSKAEKVLNNLLKNDTSVAQNNTSKKGEDIASFTENKTKENTLTIEDAIEKTKDITEEDKLNRWSIAPNAAPVYFNTLGEGSSIDPQFNGNSKTGDINMSYGISASYAVNKKLSIRSGINRVNLGYNTNNVVVFQSLGVSSNSSALRNVDVSTNNTNALAADALSNGSAETISIISATGFDANSGPESFATNTSINQSLGYIEVPLEIQYNLLNKKFGVNVIGGFSSFFLNDNKIFSEVEGGRTTFLGEATNINKVSYSANFGLGLNYQMSKKIDLNLEPMFKYQINTFNNTSGDFKPFFIGVYTGFAIKF